MGASAEIQPRKVKLAAPRAIVGINEEPVHGFAVGLLGKSAGQHGILQPDRLLVEAMQHLAGRVLQEAAAASRSGTSPRRTSSSRLRSGSATGSVTRPVFSSSSPWCAMRSACIADLGVVAMLAGQLSRPGGVPVSHEAATLGVDVSEAGASCTRRYECRGQRLELGSELCALEHIVAFDEQQKEHRRAAFQRQAAVLAQAVDRQVELSRTAQSAFRLGAEHPVLEGPQARHVLAWLDAGSHLVAVVGSGIGQPVHGRADNAAQDATTPGNRFGQVRILFLAVGHAHATARLGSVRVIPTSRRVDKAQDSRPPRR